MCAKLRSKIAKSSKIGGKVCAHHFVQIAERFEKNPPQQFRAENVDMHLYKIFFRISLYNADSSCQISYRQSKKRLGMNKFVRTKSHAGNTFSKTSLGLLCTSGIVVVHLYCGFLCGVRWRHSRPPNSVSHLQSFFTSLKKDCVANYALIWTVFSPSLRGLDVL